MAAWVSARLLGSGSRRELQALPVMIGASKWVPGFARPKGPNFQKLFRFSDAYRVFYEQPSDLAAAEAYLDARFESGDSTILLACPDGEAPVGFAQLPPLVLVGADAKDLRSERPFRCAGWQKTGGWQSTARSRA